MLGEDHGDGSWEGRRRGWQHIRVVREGLRGFGPGEDDTEKQAIAANPGQESGEELEHSSAYLMAQALMLQAQLREPDFDLMARTEAYGQLKQCFRQINLAVAQHRLHLSAWLNVGGQLDPKKISASARKKVAAFIEIVNSMEKAELWTQFAVPIINSPYAPPPEEELPEVVDLDELLSGKVPAAATTHHPPPLSEGATLPATAVAKEGAVVGPPSNAPGAAIEPISLPKPNNTAVAAAVAEGPPLLPNARERAGLIKLMQQVVEQCKIILDQMRDEGLLSAAASGIKGWFSGQNTDSIPGRAAIDKAQSGSGPSGAGGTVAALTATNPLREKIMAERIAAKEPPLLVQLGENHVKGVAAALRARNLTPVEVHTSADFNDILEQDLPH